MRCFILILIVITSVNTFAAIEISPPSKIIKIISFSEYGGGDITVKLENNGQTCTHGYWLRKSDPGYDANFSMILSAYHAKSEIAIRGHTDQIWPGSGGTYCHVYGIDFNES